jgi:hypothetical protein
MPTLALLVATTVAACLWPTDQGSQGDAPGVLVSPQAPIDTAVGLSADTYLRQGDPNQNFGTEPILRVRPTGKNRALLQVDPAVLAAVVGGGTVTGARLEVTITHNADNWGPEGRAIALHRLTVPWTETGATWNCGVDTVPGNPRAECAAGTAWEMGGAGPNPWVAAPSATALIANGLRGVVTFDVTADVAAWLSGTPNAGWILKRVDEGPSGAVEFGSRESGSPPVLVVTLAAGDTSRPPIPDGFVAPDSAVALLVSPPGDDSVLVLRNFIRVIFDDTTSGYTIRNVFARYGGRVVGGDTLLKSYMVQVPDPGPTYAALDSVLSRVRSEPGVRFAVRYVFSEPVRDPGRYPEDDPQSSRRRDWFGPGTDGTRALMAVRAPLAWGCETGLYRTDAVAIGVMEDIVDASIPDLTPSFSRLHAASASQPLNTIATFSPGALSHGTGVAGVLSALGDNGFGVAGLVWQSQLHVFRLAREDGSTTRRLGDRAQAIERAIRLAATTPVRILHSSVEAAVDPEEARILAVAIADFVNTPPGRLFVQAGGDNRYTIRPDTILKIHQGGFVMHQAMVLLDPGAKARVVMVGAANRDGTRLWDEGQGLYRDGATLITGVTDILAPSQDILVLVRPRDFSSSSVRSRSGTSFGAPMVSGTAALLWAFDPTLTADDVKGYILAGASERMGASGTVEPSPVIPNSGGLHLLDAYEALARASRERPNTTPICGGQVWARETSIYVDQGAPSPRIIPVPGAHFLGLASVAQGGRRIAVTDWQFPNPTQTLVVTNTGGIDSVLNGVYARQYLERGTADLKFASPGGSFAEGLALTLRGTGVDLTDQRLDGVTAPPGASESRAEYIFVSPLGDLAAVQTQAWMPDGSSTDRWDLVRLTSPPQAAANVMNLQFAADPIPCWTNCPLGIWSAAWAHDSRRVVFTLPHADFYQGGGGGGGVLVPPAGVASGAQLEEGDIIGIATRLVSVPLVNGVAQPADSTPLLEGEWLVSPRLTADDVLLVAEHLGLVDGVVGGTCEEKRRLPTSPFTVQAGRAPLLAAFCDPYADGPRIFNAPPAAVASRTRDARRR